MDEEEFDDLQQELPESADFYSFLNVSKKATDDEINNAFRRLSRIYHPDKHQDPVRKQMAEKLFNKIKKAHEVLADPHKRAIYDTLGERGLETEGWQIVQRTKTPQEIRDEYERLAKDREEKLLLQRTNPKGQATVNIDARDLFERYDTYKTSSLPDIEITQMSISQSIDFPLTVKERMSLSGNLKTEFGRGSGTITTSFKKTTGDHHWIEVEGSAGSGVQLVSRGNISWPTYKSFGSVGLVGHIHDGMLSPGLQLMIAKHFDHHTIGYLTWRVGRQSSITTTIVYSDEKNYVYAALQLGIPHSLLHLTYVRKFEQNEAKLKMSLKLRSLGGVFEYGYEQRVTKHSILSASILADIPLGVTLRIRLNRGNQQYMCNLHLSQDLQPSAIFYGTVVPLLVYESVKHLIIIPYNKRQKLKEAEEMKAKNADKIAETRMEARAAVELMKQTYEKVREVEESKSGLVIVKAWFGVMSKADVSNTNHSFSVERSKIIDVTIPLQCLVKNSQLIVFETPKSSLPGFYDPCPGEAKSLHVLYKFRDKAHDICISEEQPLKIPKQAHKVGR